MNIGAAEWLSHELVLLSATDDAELAESARALKLFLDRTPHAPVSSVAYSCAKRYSPDGAVLAVVTPSVEDLRGRLALAADRIAGGASRIRDRSGTYWFRRDPLSPPPKLAYIFPGALSFYPDMMRDISLLFPVCRGAFDLLEEAMTDEDRFTPSSFVFPPAVCYRHDADVFAAGGYAEAMVSVMASESAMLRLLATAGLRPNAVAGLSGGDLSALACCGSLGEMERRKRIDFTKAAYDLAARIVKGMPALSGRQTVLDPAWCLRFRSEIRSFAKRWMKYEPEIPVYSFATASPFPDSFRKARDAAAEIWYAPSRVGETAERMYADGVRLFLEVGPRSLMCTAFKEALRGRPDAEIIPSNRAHRSGVVQLQHALALMAALGRPFDPAAFFAGRRVREIDFSSSLSLEVKASAYRTLKRDFPHPVPSAPPSDLGSAQIVPAGAATPGARAKGRAAAQAARDRRQRQFDFGASQPLVSDAVAENDGESVEIVKTFRCDEVPLFADFALGASQISYSDRDLRGFTPLTLFGAAEIMAELAARLVSGKRLVALLDVKSSRTLAFVNGRLRLRVRAERALPAEIPARVLADDPSVEYVRAALRSDAADAARTADVWAATFVFADAPPPRPAFVPEPLRRPRSVHWTEREIYPDRLFAGERLRYIRSADVWSEVGLEYEVEVPPSNDAVRHTTFPLWEMNPLLFSVIADGYRLWRSHEYFAGAFSFAFRLLRLTVHAAGFTPGTHLNCHLRLTGATEKSNIVAIRVTDGNGQIVCDLEGYEEFTERAPVEYVRLVRAPAAGYLTRPLDPETFGETQAPFATACARDIPYPIFERNGELWLNTVSQIVLASSERRQFAEMPGSVRRRTEWLFGRIAAKDAVRRFLHERYQARWSCADVQIWADDQGKPHPIGEWGDRIAARIDLSISHTADFVVAVAAANAHVGIDVERADRDLTEEFVKGVFTTEELELAAVAGEDASIRFWCAKECVSKALGTGIRYSPRELVVKGYDPEDGMLSVVLEGAWLEAFKLFRGRSVSVRTSVVLDHVVASCFVPDSFFE